MQIGMVGLGKMGGSMTRRLMKDGHEVVVFDVNEKAIKKSVSDGAKSSENLKDLVSKLDAPRAVWLMLPDGKITGDTIMEVAELMDEDDIIIDGGNSNFNDDIERGKKLKSKGIRFLDVGTSGGVFGEERGYCLMVGGDKSAFDEVEPILKTIAPGKGNIEETRGRENLDSTADEGYLYCGKTGAGHYVKMVHNGIEYGLMQAYAEGFDLFSTANSEDLPEDKQYDLDLPDIAEVWRRGSVIASWLLDLTSAALAENPDLSDFSGVVNDSGEGRWTINAAIDQAVPVNVLSAALYARFRSRQKHTFGEKTLSAMRNQFGGHEEPDK